MMMKGNIFMEKKRKNEQKPKVLNIMIQIAAQLKKICHVIYENKMDGKVRQTKNRILHPESVC